MPCILHALRGHLAKVKIWVVGGQYSTCTDQFAYELHIDWSTRTCKEQYKVVEERLVNVGIP